MTLLRMIAVEIRRALFTWKFLITLVLGFVLICFGLWEYCLSWNNFFYVPSASSPYKCNAYDAVIWSLGSVVTLVVPLLALIPFADSYVVDRNSGYLRYLLVRSSHKKYLISKTIAVLVSGGLALAIPTLLLIIYARFAFPLGLPPAESARIGGEYPNGPFPTLYRTNSDLYVLFLMGLTFLFGSAYALFGLAISAFTKNRFVVLATPFILYHIANLALALLGLAEWTPPMTFTPNGVSTTSAVTVFGELGGILLLSLAVFSLSVRSRAGREYA